jgi:hypothetical protein
MVHTLGPLTASNRSPWVWIWCAHVDHGDAVGKAVADIGVAAIDHDLDAVAAAALVAVAEEFDVM